ncbi:type II toxin-antitoxin system HicB family antitoxin [Dactylosporangium sp. CA-092794]|uniref:type II toxin-antitoxin system HicB family antitoxin n=1 Tax=Dactylosporangium sp. CA-092794 TaxID=3239929 RepID=UPI003D949428
MTAMTVGDYLRVPYLVTAQSVPLPDGSWVRRVEHPELPDCAAQAESILDALALLDTRRIETVLAMLASGQTPPTRRYLLGDTQARQRVQRAGLAERVEPLWRSDGQSLRERAG